MKKKKLYALKTKDLIKLLQEADPEGEGLAVVGGSGIYSVQREPLYYDGWPDLLVLDENKKPYWHVDKMVITDKIKHYTKLGIKYKVHIETIDDETLVWDEQKVVVDYKDKKSQDYHTERINKTKEESDDCKKRLREQKNGKEKRKKQS